MSFKEHLSMLTQTSEKFQHLNKIDDANTVFFVALYPY